MKRPRKMARTSIIHTVRILTMQKNINHLEVLIHCTPIYFMSHASTNSHVG